MKRGDVIWGGVLIASILLFVIPAIRDPILAFSHVHPYISGFANFAILATMGDLLGKRIVSGVYKMNLPVLWRAIVWGIIGCMVTLVFPIYMGGAGQAQAEGILPFSGIAFTQAFFASSVMNLTFAPVMNTFHRLMELLIEHKTNPTHPDFTFKQLIGKINWQHFVTFNWLKVGILFWIPVHTIVFILPEAIRVVVAAFCSIALGIILSFAAKRNQELPTAHHGV